MRFTKILVYAMAVFASLSILFVCIILTSGRGQVYTPEMLRHQIALGMSVSEVELALGTAPNSLQGKTPIELASPGLWSLVGVPQNHILLYFDDSAELKSVSVVVHCMADEETYGLELNPKAREVK